MATEDEIGSDVMGAREVTWLDTRGKKTRRKCGVGERRAGRKRNGGKIVLGCTDGLDDVGSTPK